MQSVSNKPGHKRHITYRLYEFMLVMVFSNLGSLFVCGQSKFQTRQDFLQVFKIFMWD